jgi:DMSO reductase anchor subunit
MPESLPESLLDFWDVWHQPALGALHVLGIAWFAGALFADAPRMRRVGIVWMLLTGVALFALNPARIAASASFRVKLVLLVVLLFIRQPRWLVLAMWVGVIFASRWMAYV